MRSRAVAWIHEPGPGGRSSFHRPIVLALAALTGLSAPAAGQLQPCCQKAGELPSCVLPWTGGGTACEAEGGAFFQANHCRAGASCVVVHEVPVQVEAITGEIVLVEGLEKETLTLDGSLERGTLILRSDPTCFTPPQAGTDCTIESELVALDLAGLTELGEIVLHDSPTILTFGEIGPVQASSDGCHGPASGSFDLPFGLDLPALTLELKSTGFPHPKLEGVLEVGGADCSTLRGALALTDRALLTSDVTLPPSSAESAAVSGAKSRQAVPAARQQFYSGQLSTLALALPAEPASVLEIPAVSLGGLAFLALLLGAAALAVLARR